MTTQDMYAWNFFQTRELEALTGHLNSSFWVLPIVHGAFLQRRCNLFGRLLNVTLIARRSRRFAGTRYLKRGVSDDGNVANDVEVEQVCV
jgi:phosphatidylinositol 3,5-bisphosphate 5-phosphatase